MSEQKDKAQSANQQENSAQDTAAQASAEPKVSEAEAREKIIKNLSKGTIKLEVPITARGEAVQEVHYDFNQVRGLDYIEAMDSDLKATNAFKITMKQAFELFLKGARHCNRDAGLDERDLRERMSMPDVIAATRLALVFFVAKSRGADERTRNG